MSQYYLMSFQFCPERKDEKILALSLVATLDSL